MKKAAILPLIALFFLSAASCKQVPDMPGTSSGERPPEGASFYAQNMVNGSFYELKAEMLYEGARCKIWVEKGSGVTKEQARSIANIYDSRIRPIIIDTFSKKNLNFTYEEKSYPFNDMLDFANWLVGGKDKKLTILMLDIKDGYKKGDNSFVAGYFFAADFLNKGPNLVGTTRVSSNGRDMIYIDTDPGFKLQPEQAYATFAHELQHLVNFVTTVYINRVNAAAQLVLTDTWVNEGLSAYAEYLYFEDHPEDKRFWLNSPQNTISKGNNFFVWDDATNITVLDDYTTVYLFFQWLYLQASTELRTHIFRDIAYSRFADYRAVTNVGEGSTWENLLRRWLAANYYPANGDYGYKGDTELQKMIKITPIGGSTIQLRPGEGVYSIIDNNSANPAAGGPNIKYAGIDENSNTISTSSSPYSGDTLLTFNANTNNAKTTSPETGYLTGVSPSITVSPSAANSRQAETPSHTYVIDAQDLLGRDREGINIRLPR